MKSANTLKQKAVLRVGINSPKMNKVVKSTGNAGLAPEAIPNKMSHTKSNITGTANSTQ